MAEDSHILVLTEIVKLCWAVPSRATGCYSHAQMLLQIRNSLHVENEQIPDVLFFYRKGFKKKHWSVQLHQTPSVL